MEYFIELTPKQHLSQIKNIKDWIEENIEGYWNFYNSFHGKFIWVFGKEEDAIAFKLRWM